MHVCRRWKISVHVSLCAPVFSIETHSFLQKDPDKCLPDKRQSEVSTWQGLIWIYEASEEQHENKAWESVFYPPKSYEQLWEHFCNA